MKRALNFINGEFVPAAQGEKFFVIDDPATGEVVCEVPDSSIMDVVRSVQAANKVLKNWLATDSHKRSEFLETFASTLEARAPEIAELEARETGVTLKYAASVSLPRAIQTLRYFARVAEPTDALMHESSGYFIKNHLPIGVVVAIASYSDPVVRICLALGAALAAGNVLILKASSRTPQTAQALAQIVQASALPAGVFNLIQGRGEEVGRALVTHPGLSTLAFTGRTENAREIQGAAAEFLKRTQFSLSGSNPVLIFAENDLAKIAPKVASLVFAHQGAAALRGARVFIQETVYDQFLELLKIEVSKLVIGDPLDAATQVGPIVKPHDHSGFTNAVSQALKERAKTLCGGAEAPVLSDAKLANGRFVQPTALYDLTFCSTLQQEEIIGPLATVASFKYQNDAIKHANNSPFGQAAYVFHGNGAKAAKIAMKLEAGRVTIGGSSLWDVRASNGGLKTSGLGRDGALESLKFFSRESLLGFDISG